MKITFDRSITGAFLAVIVMMEGLGCGWLRAVDRTAGTARGEEHSQALREMGAGCAIVIVAIATLLLIRTMRGRRCAEKILRLRERSMRLMIESVKDYAIIMLDAAGHVMSWNSGAQRMKGYRAEEIIGRHFSIFYPADKVREGYPQWELRETARLGRFEDEGLRLRADGTGFLANIVFTAIRDEAGELIGFVKVTRDITEARQTERRILMLNDELNQRANELETSNKELEAFSYSVSHDLRAPLRHIAGFVDMLERAPSVRADASSLRCIGVIAKATKQMGELIDDLLDFSRTGRSEMFPIEVDMRHLVDEVIAALEMDWKGRRVTWEIGQLDPVRGDPHLLRLVWTNLISNALKYTRPRHEAHIEIGQDRSAAGRENGFGNEIAFYVRDNGVGFDMEYEHKLFGVFQRLHRAEEFEGTGIGLANVQRIVHRHGGRVWARGKPGEGAVFNFSLPIHPVFKLQPVPEPCPN